MRKRSSAREGVEGDGAGVGDVEAADGAVHVEPHKVVAAVAGELAEALAFRAQHDGDGG